VTFDTVTRLTTITSATQADGQHRRATFAMSQTGPWTDNIASFQSLAATALQHDAVHGARCTVSGGLVAALSSVALAYADGVSIAAAIASWRRLPVEASGATHRVFRQSAGTASGEHAERGVEQSTVTGVAASAAAAAAAARGRCRRRPSKTCQIAVR